MIENPQSKCPKNKFMTSDEAGACLNASSAAKKWDPVVEYSGGGTISRNIEPGIYMARAGFYYAYVNYLFAIDAETTTIHDPTGGTADLQVNSVGGFNLHEGNSSSSVPGYGAVCSNCKFTGLYKLQ
jgi:hypothetical protein